jgi:hypothetical protein
MLMTIVEQILTDVHAVLLAHFRHTWIIVTATAAICVAWAVGRTATTRSKSESKTDLFLTRRLVGMPKDMTALALLAVFLGSYSVMILVWEDFAYYDNSSFTLFTLKGHNIAPPIWQGEGRFLPLGYQEFNLVRHFTDTIIGYHVLAIAQLFVFVSILLLCDDELSIAARVALAFVALLTPSILISFSGLIFPERNVLFLLACLVLSIKRFEKTQSTPWAVTAAVCAQIMIYYKETAFLLLLGLAAGRLILRCRDGRYWKWDRHRLWDREGRLDFCLACLAVLFLLYYFAVMGIHPNIHYATVRRQPIAEILLAYLRLDLLVWFFVAVVLARIYLILRYRIEASPLWDGLAFGGVACFVAYDYLGIFAPNYLAPVDLIAVLYVGRFAILLPKKTHLWSKVTVLLLTFAVLVQNVVFSAFSVFERKNGIYAKVEIARVVEAQSRGRAGDAVRLFFPFAKPYVIMEFASYLSYRGIAVEGFEEEGSGRNPVVLTAAAVAKDGPCIGYRSVECHAVSGPASGDLVIVLPDDEASLAQASVYRAGRELLFFYEPHPPIPQWLDFVIANLHVAAGEFTLPDRWMDGSVTIWK